MDHSGLHHPGDYHHHHEDYHPRGRGESPVSEMDHLMRDYEPDSDLEGHPRRDCHSPNSSVGDVDTVAGKLDKLNISCNLHHLTRHLYVYIIINYVTAVNTIQYLLLL